MVDPDVHGDPIVDDSSEAANGAQQQRHGMSDKIPSHHSDLIIAMILSRADELFADNRKRKPIYNARRKAKWKELVENLNSQLGMDYSVERVKNNYHYRVTSLKRNMNKQLSNARDGSSLAESNAFQQFSDIDKMLYEIVRQSANSDDFQPAIKKKKVKKSSVAEAPDFLSALAQLDDLPNASNAVVQSQTSESRTTMLENEDAASSNDSNEDSGFRKPYAQLIRNQIEMFQAMRNFMNEQSAQQAKVVEMMAATVDLVRESTTHLERLNAPCPTCTGNLLENLVQAYGQTLKDSKSDGLEVVEEACS